MQIIEDFLKIGCLKVSDGWFFRVEMDAMAIMGIYGHYPTALLTDFTLPLQMASFRSYQSGQFL